MASSLLLLVLLSSVGTVSIEVRVKSLGDSLSKWLLNELYGRL